MNNYDHNPPSLTLLHLRNLDSTADYKLVQALSRYCVKDPSQLLDDKASVFASQGFPGLLWDVDFENQAEESQEGFLTNNHLSKLSKQPSIQIK